MTLRRVELFVPAHAIRRHAVRSFALICFAFVASLTQAAVSTWNGGGGNVNWSTPGNWDVTPVSSAGTDIIFAGITNTGTSGTPLNQNIFNPFRLNTLTFSAGGGAFFIGGGPLEWEGTTTTITQNSSSAESIANDFSPGANFTVAITLAGNGTGLVTLGGTISVGNGARDYAIVKNGSSSFALSGASTYSGGTTINAGSLFINNSSGSGTGTGTVAVNGGTLGGSGTISGAVTIASGANLSPGAMGSGSTAILHTGSLSLNSGANFVLDLNNTTVGTGYDQVSVTGTVNITGSNLVLNPGAGLSIGDTFFILANDGVDPVTGMFSQGATITAGFDTFSINYAANFGGAGAGNDISLTLIGIVPESSTWIAGLVAFAALGCHQARRVIGRRIRRLP